MKPNKITNAMATWFDLLAILFLLTGGVIIWSSFNADFSYAVNTFVQDVLLITLVGFFCWLRRGNLADLGLKSWPSLQDVLLGILGGLGLFVLMYLASLLLKVLPWSVPPQAAAAELSSLNSWSDFLAILVSVAILAPLSEELFFRAYCLPLFANSWGINIGSIYSALFFGSLHFDKWRLLPLTLAGWILNYLYIRTASLWPPIIAHSCWNGALALLIFWNGSLS